uniref:Putative secreted protein n=1 Tax=Anopheles triannulatus TaxID=58253 RepID=A0A2M4B1H2_9DIPT
MLTTFRSFFLATPPFSPLLLLHFHAHFYVTLSRALSHLHYRTLSFTHRKLTLDSTELEHHEMHSRTSPQGRHSVNQAQCRPKKKDAFRFRTPLLAIRGLERASKC